MTKRHPLNIPGIYAITSAVNETAYIGQANKIWFRWQTHRNALNKGKHTSRHLQNAWNKYGEDAFVFTVLESFGYLAAAELPEALNRAEIAALSACARSYNLMEAGQSGMLASDETKAILSEQRLALWQDPEHREKRMKIFAELHADPIYTARRMAAVHEGKRTPESRAKTSAEAKARWADPEFRARMGEKKRLSWQDPDYRERQSKSRTATWADPKVRDRRVKGLVKAWEGRKPKPSAPNQLVPVDNPVLPTPRSGVVEQQGFVDLLLHMFRHVSPAE